MIQDFREILTELVAAKARFLVVGAHALSAHGVPRATVDLDIWIAPVPDNAIRVYQALAQFGASLETLGVAVSDFTELDMVTQFGVPPYRIDILTSVSGVTFEDAWQERIEAEIEGVLVPILGLRAFVANKRASGRKRTWRTWSR